MNNSSKIFVMSCYILSPDNVHIENEKQHKRTSWWSVKVYKSIATNKASEFGDSNNEEG